MTNDEITKTKLHCIDQGIASLKRAIKTSQFPVIAEIYEKQITILQNWASQVKAGKDLPGK